VVIGAALCGALLTACSKPEATATVNAANTPAPAEAAASVSVTSSEQASTAPPAAATAPVVAAAELDLASMHQAQPSGKAGVPVDLHYQFDGDALSGGPVTLHLAAVPRVAGANLKVSIKPQAGIQFGKGTLSAEKVTASSTYRQQLSVQRMAQGPTELRVLVEMDLPIGSGFTWFSVPLGPQPATGKQQPDRIE
jgi:hypothetical protein